MRKNSMLIILGILGIAAVSTCFVFLTGFSRHPFSGVEGAVAAGTEGPLYDLVIKHAQILDGTGERDLFRGDIAIKAGKIVKVGLVTENELKGSFQIPVFDAGGLTVMPSPVKPESGKQAVEHLFCTSFPRYAAHCLFFREGSYAGLSLAQVARQREEEPQATFADLRRELPAKTKVYLVSSGFNEKGVLGEGAPSTVAELVAFYTGHLAEAIGQANAGRIAVGCNADLYFFITHNYAEESLPEMFRKGELPALALGCKDGKLYRGIEELGEK